jgi:predicted phage terminase large subunit-like protein
MQLSPEEIQFVVTAARESLLDFCQTVDDNYEVSWHLEMIAAKLEEALNKVLRGIPARIILELPPRHGKSELATIKFPAWVLGEHPELPIIVGAYSSDLAEDFGMKTKDLMNDERYHAIFKTRLRKDSKAKGKWTTEKKGGYTAAGIGGAFTGRGFKIGIIDDPFKNRQEADSAVFRKRVWEWYKSTFYTRQDGQGAIIIIAQRWHKKDLIGMVKDFSQEQKDSGVLNYDNWEVISLPAIAEHDEKFRKKGEALWPEKFPIEKLLTTKNTLGPYEFSALYQQQPISKEMQIIQSHWFKDYEQQDIKNLILRHTTTVDVSTGQGNDNGSVVTVGKPIDDPRWFIREETTGKFDPLQTIDAIFYHYEKYRSEVWIETVSYQKTLKFWIEEEMKKRNIYFFIHELTKNTKISKEQRIMGLVAPLKAGVMYFLKSMVELKEELVAFPQGTNDDRADALASQLEAIENTKQKMRPFKQSDYQPQTKYGI